MNDQCEWCQEEKAVVKLTMAKMEGEVFNTVQICEQCRRGRPISLRPKSIQVWRELEPGEPYRLEGGRLHTEKGETMLTEKPVCPGCGQPNEFADDEGFTDEFPREWHAKCARAAVERGQDPRKTEARNED